MLTQQEILSRFTKVKGQNNQYTACCPAHRDKEPSLAIKFTDTKVLFHCFAGCSFDGIIQSVGLSNADVMLSNASPSRVRKVSKKVEKEPTKEPVKEFAIDSTKEATRKPLEYIREHIYTDFSGKPIAVKKIFKKNNNSKTAIWFLLNEQGEISEYDQFGKPKAGLKGLKMPLYALPRLSKSNDTVFIVEGEKDVDTLLQRDITATTSPSGAGAKWLADYSKTLIERSVVILTDNDTAGTNHGIKVAESLVSYCKSVKILPCSLIAEHLRISLQDKGDITDILALKDIPHLKDFLKKLSDKQPEYALKIAVNNVDFLEIINFSALEPLKISKKFLDYFAVFNALNAVGISLRLNIMNNQIELYGHKENIKKLGDNQVQSLSNAIRWLLLKLNYKYPSSVEIAETLSLIADQKQYHPVREIIEDNTWDGFDRLPQLYEIMGVTDTHTQLLIKKWLIQSVAMLYNDKNQALQAEGVLVLQGDEGIGKTTLLEKLAIKPCFFQKSATIDMTIKDTQIKALSAWISEIGELDSTTRKNQSDLKGFITETYDNIRRPYAKESVRIPRRTSFCGSVNPQHFLHDSNGYRRWWTIPVPNMNLKAILSINEDFVIQLYSQMRFAFLKDSSAFRLTKQELEDLKNSNSEYSVSSNGEEELLSLLDFSIPKQEWEAYTYADISNLLFSKFCVKISSTHIGRVINKIERNFGLEFKKTRKFKEPWRILLPLIHTT